MYNFREMSAEEVTAKATKYGALLGKNQFVRQLSPKWSFAHFFTDTELIENAAHSARNQAVEFEIAMSQCDIWCPAFAAAYTGAYQAELVAYQMRTRPTAARQQEEW